MPFCASGFAGIGRSGIVGTVPLTGIHAFEVQAAKARNAESTMVRAAKVVKVMGALR